VHNDPQCGYMPINSNTAPPSHPASPQELRQKLEEATEQLAAARKEVEAQIRRAAAAREQHKERVAALEKEVAAAQAAAVEAASGQQVADGLAQEARRWGWGTDRSATALSDLPVHLQKQHPGSNVAVFHSTACDIAHKAR
jgi:hypothetical protein